MLIRIYHWNTQGLREVPSNLLLQKHQIENIIVAITKALQWYALLRWKTTARDMIPF